MTGPYAQPDADIEETGKPAVNIARPNYLRGTKPLWKAFWIVLVLGCVGLGIISGFVLSVGLDVMPYLPGGLFQNANRLTLTLGAIQGLYLLYASFAVWRCAQNTRFTYARFAARLVVILLVVSWLWRFSWFTFIVVLGSNG